MLISDIHRLAQGQINFKKVKNLNSLSNIDSCEGIYFSDNLLASLNKLQLSDLSYIIFSKVKYAVRCYNTFKDEGNINSKMTKSEFWQTMSQAGFTDYEERFDLWVKPYGSIHSNNSNYMSTSKNPLLWDANKIYSHVMGTSPVTAASVLSNTIEIIGCEPSVIVEAMCGSSEFTLFGQGLVDSSFTLMDISPNVIDALAAINFIRPPTIKLADIFKPSNWPKHVDLTYIGKQSINYFPINKVLDFFKFTKAKSKILALETIIYDKAIYKNFSQDLTPPQLPKTVKISLKATSANSLAKNLNFDMRISYKGETKILFEYPWTMYSTSDYVTILLASGYSLSNIYTENKFGKLCSIENFIDLGKENEVVTLYAYNG